MKKIPLRWFTRDEEFPFFIQYGGHSEDFYLHKHMDFAELVVVLHGHATHIVDDEVSFIKKGHVFVISGETSHAYKDPCDFKICNIMFRPEILQHHLGSDLLTFDGYHSMFVLEPLYRNSPSEKSQMVMSLNDFDYIESFIADMINEYHLKQPAYQTLLTSKLTELIVYLSRYHQSNGKSSDGQFMHLAAAISYIEDHFLEQITLEEIASQCNISIRHLNRIFKSFYQTSPMAYLKRLRLERACQLLRLTDLSITQVSYQSGFNDSNYFARQFRQTYKMSPKLFRQSELT
ncbi:helix-turn-helix domain-containing protein [Paenibacillus sp. MABNR03]|uniref:helix-turn-helix domain-containing protein n=1 Tax=Paenibacillus sp. MABNR03 TaxID=3142626 RepID=UPI003D2CA0D2